ncbi:TonB-dependent receptor [Marinigracilibium pacificum]|uniref:TonB-dependent receptor n=1 Tax=Marinigracilibium pacificum TaxID=2729599 RepID=A0A848J0Y0_9BACT|nr:TonB-dependent receptor [Marinigracilibium pacificum]NMM47949.1 TonB-dependent receptor [Marinigracilibium pacificum]
MKNILFRLFFIIVFGNVINISAQSIKLVNKDTGLPVSSASITSSEGNIQVITDENGIAKIDDFINSSILNINHSSYYPLAIPKDNLTEKNNIIYLEERIIKMDEMVVSANKWEQPKSEIARQMAYLDAKDIVDLQPQTSADLLSSTGQVFIQKSQMGGGSPMIRGFAANSVLLVIDGVRMNNAIYRSGNLQNILNIDPLSLQSAEVIFGPGSVIYGSDALGGVMDFHTITPDLSLSKPSISGNAMTRYSSANHEKTGHLSLNIGGKKLASFTSISYSDFDDLRTGKNYPSGYKDFFERKWYVKPSGDANDEIIINTDPEIQKPSGYNQFGVIQKIKYSPSNKFNVGYNFYYNKTGNVPRYDRLILEENGTPENAEWYYGPQNWMMNSLNLTFKNSNLLFDQSKVTIAIQNYEESRNDRKFRDESLRTRTENVDVYSLNLDNEKVINKINLFYGIEFLHNDVASKAVRKNIITGVTEPNSTRYPANGSSYMSAAAYALSKYIISDKLILNTGIRYTYVESNVDFGEIGLPMEGFTNKNGALTGSASLIFQPDEINNLSLSYGSGFRAPNIDDAAKVFDSEPGNVVVPNPDLEPEFNHSIEIGYKAYKEDIFTLEAIGFYSYLTNAMERRDYIYNGESSIDYDGTISNVQAEVNIGSAKIYGFSFNGSLSISKNIFFSSTITVSDGETSDGESVRHVVPLFGRSTIKYVRSKWDIFLNIQYQGGIEFDKLSPSEQNKTHLYTEDGAIGWTTFNLGGSVQLSKSFIINAGIDNITDLHYRPYSSGISAPGRNLFISARYLF